ncbi:type II toxin-antitoxin system VapC family toxin [Rhizobium sp. 0TCS1.26]|uniref:type II toxin-antitoxin system VapC family toxin n=1 Tax=Rhizobium sp. 0TCS1.26 TaxID=3142623 RepID=UPI003D2A7E9F
MTRETAFAALDAFSRYGKGHHQARLNFGDRFPYAGAKAAAGGQLNVGDDLRRTDLG